MKDTQSSGPHRINLGDEVPESVPTLVPLPVPRREDFRSKPLLDERMDIPTSVLNQGIPDELTSGVKNSVPEEVSHRVLYRRPK